MHYKYVDIFTECNGIIDGFITGKVPKNLENTDKIFQKYNILRNKFTLNECDIVSSYLMEIDSNIRPHNISLEAGALFLYYWIHDKLSYKGISIYTKDVYNAFIKEHHQTYGTDVFKDYIDITFRDGVMKNVNSLYDMYSCLNHKKVNGSYAKDNNFCNSLDVFVNKYNENIGTLASRIIEKKISLPCQKNMAVTILITTVTFGSHGLSLLHKIKSIKNTWNYMDQELRTSQESYISNIDSRDIGYNLLYD
ncbi:variable surface protein [Plasmodium gonderi]|uniref:Variable surface protein n=1 Tax=Plasmodium gonderi TaxID=77519 RepID=A0A1Y1JU23_PLAGO|nr:variable surface protein [Plasmodium gonderi]GAW83903.1 variable surface protein [Plasmodium gonderi]